MTYRPNAPKNVRIAGLDWSEHYNTYRSLVAGWLKLEFTWQSGEGYVISIADVKIKARGADPEASAEIALRAARKLMEKAQEALAQAAAET
jgi:hypothetical protein